MLKCGIETDLSQFKFGQVIGYSYNIFPGIDEVFSVTLKSDTQTFYNIQLDDEGVYHGRSEGSGRDGYGL